MIGTWGETRLAAASRRSRRAATVGLAILAVLALLGWDHRAPRPEGQAAPASTFSAGRAMLVLDDVARVPHAVHQPDHGRVRDLLIAELQRAGAEVEVQAATMAGRPVTYNILATARGTAGEDADTILAAAHYDSVADAPGAADDGVGTVALVEAARALLAGPPIRNDVVFLITDGEEQGLWGADVFVEQHPLAPEIDLILNFESGGPRGPVILLEVDKASTDMLRTFAAAAPRPVTSSLLDDLVAGAREASIASTDFVPFRRLGQPGFNFANSKDTGFRHTPGDEFFRIEPATVQHHGSTLLGLLRAYGDRDLDEVGGDDGTVWVALFSGLLLAWPHGFAWVLLGVILLMTAWAVATVRRAGVAGTDVARGALATVAAMLAAVVTSVLLLGLIQLVRSDHAVHMNGLSPRLTLPGAGVPNGEAYWFGALGIVAGVSVVVLARARRRIGPLALALGAHGVLLAFAVLTTWRLPGASHLFVLPLLGLLPGLALQARNPNGTAVRPVGALLGALPTIVIAGGLMVFFETFTIANVTLMAPFAALYVAQLALVLESIADGGRLLPVTGTAGAGAVLLVGALLTVSATEVTAQDQYVGPPDDAVVSRDQFAEAGAWRLDRLGFEDKDRLCVEAGWVGPRSFAWCPLPEDVRPDLDVQQVRFGDQVLLFGGTRDDVAVVAAIGSSSSEVATTTIPGLDGRFFAVVVPAGDAPVSVVGRDASGLEVARLADIVLPDEDTKVRQWRASPDDLRSR